MGEKGNRNLIKNPPLSINQVDIDSISRILANRIKKEAFQEKYAPAKEVLKLVAVGAFLAASIAVPNLPLALKPFLKKESDYEDWRKLNIPYLKRTLNRLESQKLVEVTERDDIQEVKITDKGKTRILRFALEELKIEKPKNWNGDWYLVSYDLPEEIKSTRRVLQRYLSAWGFYKLHESVYLHAYPCVQEIEFLRNYLGISKYMRIFIVAKIENPEPFRVYFGIKPISA